MRLMPDDFENKSLLKLILNGYQHSIKSFAYMTPFLLLLVTVQFFSYEYVFQLINHSTIMTSLTPLVQMFMDFFTFALYFSFVGRMFISQRSRYDQKQLDSLIRTLKMIFGLFVSTILYFIALVGGSLLFIIPGFLFLIWFNFFPIILTYERVGVIAAFKRSKGIVRGVFFKVLGLLLIFHGIRTGLFYLFTTISLHDYMAYIIPNLLTIPAETYCLLLVYLSQRSEKEAIDHQAFLKDVS